MKVAEIKLAFESLKDDNRAIGMKAYMKNQFDFYGVNSPGRKSIQKECFPEILKLETNKIWSLVLDLWEEKERELQLFAIDLMNKIPKKRYRLEDMELIEKTLSNKQWWDTVDAIASNIVGKWFLVFPEQRDNWLKKWRSTDDFWLHRTCLIFQLKYKDQTDIELLEELIEQFKTNKEFFIQKAIGWTLRQYSRENAALVEDIVANQELSGLAKREALRLIH